MSHLSWEVQNMKKYRICGSKNGVDWQVWGYAGSLPEARDKASICIRKTKHTYVRIQVVDIDNPYERRFL